MRLTNNVIMRRYLSNLSANLNQSNKLKEIATSQKKFSKASEDPAAALKALKVRRDLSKIDLFQSNVEEIKTNLTGIESALSSLNDIAIDVNSRIIQGENTTYSDDERKTIATALRSMQQLVLDDGNTALAGKYLFGGTGKDEMPFSVSAGGKLLYHGADMDAGAITDDAYYVDIGMGMGAGAAKDSTAYNATYSGTKLLGQGKDANGITNNFYNLIGEIADQFESGDLSNLAKYTAKFKDKASDILVQYADIGERTNYVELVGTRLETDESNAFSKQESLESADLAEALMNVQYQELAYTAALQVGSKILQNSLLDYLR